MRILITDYCKRFYTVRLRLPLRLFCFCPHLCSFCCRRRGLLGSLRSSFSPCPSQCIISLMTAPSSYLSSVLPFLWTPSLILLSGPNSFYVFFNYLIVLLHHGAYHRFNLVWLTVSLLDYEPLTKGRKWLGFFSPLHPPCLVKNRYLIITVERINRNPTHKRYLENGNYYYKILASKGA